MFALKRIYRSPIKQSYCFCSRIFSQTRSVSQATENEKDPAQTFLEEYEEKLLYNTIIESNRMRYGYKKNAQILTKQSKLEESLKIAKQSVQPLPLSLRYALDDTNNIPEEITTDESISNPEITSSDDLNTSTNFPYNVNTKIENVEKNNTDPKEPELFSIKNEIIARKKILDESKENWMTHYENYEEDLLPESENEATIEGPQEWKVNYGTPDPNCPISNVPCGGCGAHLHCKDTAIPGYIPSEIFKNCFSPGGANLGSILCQRCHFLKEYNIALQVRVSPDDYPKVLQTIAFKSALAILMVDLTDFPCSIWPGLADILGPKAPIVVVGNKTDLLPKDSKDFLKTVKQVLFDNMKLSGFASCNIRHIELVSAKTGYGVENLITSLQRIWRRNGDLYLIGCTNVGKSSLFNLLLQSDLCKIQAVDLIQRATTSPWPGTTLNLLKFPVTRFSGYQMYARHKRLEKLKHLEAEELKLKKDALHKHNAPKYATLIGKIERSITHREPKKESLDSFSTQGKSNLSGKTRMGLDEKLPEFVYGKWCYDTPGVVHPDQILHLLTTDELVKTLPKEIIRPETYCVKPGTSLFIAGLARLDFVEGPNSIRLTVFRAKTLPITICDLDKADEMYKELLGSELFAVPILKGDRAQKWPGLEMAKSFKLFGKSMQESSHDVVLSSAGWIAVNCGLNNYEFKAWTPEKRGVYIRDCLLPKAVKLRGARIRYSVAYKRHKFIL